MNRGSRTTVCLFGAYPVRVDGRPLRLAISGPTERLFQYLLVNAGKESRREYLAELFWRASSLERQRSAFSSAVWRIKRQLEPVEGLNLQCDGPVVSLEVDEAITVDARELSRVVHSVSPGAGMSEEEANRLQAALDACDAPFMEGVTADWVLTERERLFNLQIRGLTILMHWLGQRRRYEEALEIGRRLLGADPARESAQCEVMWLYVLNGQRAQALRQFHYFRTWLKQELDIEPMPETKALHDHIRRDLDASNVSDSEHSDDRADNESDKASYDSLLGAIERSRRELFEVLNSQFK
ncbi:MAG: BTAD domain-containing putative transcriptional regulator [Lysobacterales bacterium]|jgi:DNA-binding SARP family transcriptional activator